jgi:alanine racemase
MDLLTLDVTDAPTDLAHRGAWVDLIGPEHTVDDLAAEAGTIGYEVLTALGARYARHYAPAEGDAGAAS